MGTDVHGLVAGSMIYTSKYVEYLTSRVRWALLGCLLPTSKDSLFHAALGESLEVASDCITLFSCKNLPQARRHNRKIFGGSSQCLHWNGAGMHKHCHPHHSASDRRTHGRSARKEVYFRRPKTCCVGRRLKAL